MFALFSDNGDDIYCLTTQIIQQHTLTHRRCMRYHPVDGGFRFIEPELCINPLHLNIEADRGCHIHPDKRYKEASGFFISHEQINLIYLFNNSKNPLKTPLIEHTDIQPGNPFVITYRRTLSGIIGSFLEQEGIDGVLRFARGYIKATPILYKTTLADLIKEKNDDVWMLVPVKSTPQVNVFNLDNTPIVNIETLNSQIPFDQRNQQGNPL